MSTSVAITCQECEEVFDCQVKAQQHNKNMHCSCVKTINSHISAELECTRVGGGECRALEREDDMM